MERYRKLGNNFYSLDLYCGKTNFRPGRNIMCFFIVEHSCSEDFISLLEKRKLIAIKKHKGSGKYKNNIYVLLSQDNPEIYRDLSEPEELPLFIT